MSLSILTMHSDAKAASNDPKDTRNCFVEAINEEKKLWILIHSKGILHTDVQDLYRKIRSMYENIILNDHERAELQDTEQSLWKLHYKLIDEYRNRIRQSSSDTESTNSGRVQNFNNVTKYQILSKGFRLFLSEASEFFQGLIKKIRRSYGLPEKLFSSKEGIFSSLDSTKMDKCLFSCQRYLVYLGDLARYWELYGKDDVQNRKWSIAASHYLNASIIWPDSGNPQNQLALLAIYVGDELLALYHCIRSLAIKEPFPDAWDNLILLFEKNKSSHLIPLSNNATFNFSKPSERTVKATTQSSECSSKCKVGEAIEDVVLSGETGLWSLIVRMISIFFMESSFEDFSPIFFSAISELEALLLLDDVKLKASLESYQHMDATRTGPFRMLQVVSILIFTIYMLKGIPEPQKPKHVKDKEQPFLIQLALATSFIFVGRLINRCLTVSPIACNPLLPSILVFMEWLVGNLDFGETYENDEKYAHAIHYFFGSLVDLLNKFDEEIEVESPDCTALWEDYELRGFVPISHAHVLLDFSIQEEKRNGFEDINQCQVRIRRILLSALKIANGTKASQKWIFYEKRGRNFFTIESKKVSDEREEDDKVAELHKQHCRATKESEVPVNEGDHSDLGAKSTPVEEEEEILFKPIRRHNSVPLYISTTDEMSTRDKTKPLGEGLRRGSSLLSPQNRGRSDRFGFHEKMLNNIFFEEEPCIEDCVTYPSSELSISAGPPSLSAWVLKREDLIISRERNDSGIEDNASSSLTDLSINEIARSHTDINTTSVFGYTNNPISEKDCALGPRFVSSPPYSTPVPSAPFLPDDSLWFNGDPTNFDEFKDSPSPGRMDSSQWLHHYRGNFNLDQANTHFLPVQFYTQNNLGALHDHSFSRVSNYDQWLQPLSSNPMKYLEGSGFYPGFSLVYGGDEQRSEKNFHGYQRPNPYRYGGMGDAISEQQFLLQYLKEREWVLQRESK